MSDLNWNEAAKIDAWVAVDKISDHCLASWSSEGNVVFIDTLSMWNPSSGEVRHLRTNRYLSVHMARREFSGNVLCYASGRNNKAFVGTDARTIEIWNMITGEFSAHSVTEDGRPVWMKSIAYDSGYSVLAICSEDAIVFREVDGDNLVPSTHWKTVSCKKQLLDLDDRHREPMCLWTRHSKDNSLVHTNRRGNLMVRRPPDHEQTIIHGNSPINATCLACHPIKPLVAVGHAEGSIDLFDLGTGTVSRLTGQGRIIRIGFSKDGYWLATMTDTCEVCLRLKPEWQELCHWNQYSPGFRSYELFHPTKSKLLLPGDSETTAACVWAVVASPRELISREGRIEDLEPAWGLAILTYEWACRESGESASGRNRWSPEDAYKFLRDHSEEVEVFLGRPYKLPSFNSFRTYLSKGYARLDEPINTPRAGRKLRGE